MEEEEYNNILKYLIDEIYPPEVLASPIPAHSKKKFREKVKLYRVGEHGKLYKVFPKTCHNLEREINILMIL